MCTTLINNNTTILSSLNVSGVTTINNNTNIKGIVSIHNGKESAVPNGKMSNGSLTIGDTSINYGNQFYATPPNYDGPDWTINTSGLLMECFDSTEIAVHANDLLKVSSLISYQGPTNTITLGRNMGWGTSSVVIAGNLSGPNLIKKQIFNFICSTPTVIDGNTYYRYDINLNLYTTYYSRYSGAILLGKTRKFKFMSWLTTGAHELVGGDDLNYDISCSYKYLTPTAGLFINAYGWPFENKRLSLINPNGPFLLRNSFDYITYCCRIQHSLITVMIIDYI